MASCRCAGTPPSPAPCRRPDSPPAPWRRAPPTSAAVGLPLSANLKKACFVDDMPGLDDSPLACAYARARGTEVNLDDVIVTIALALENVQSLLGVAGGDDAVGDLVLHQLRGGHVAR